MIKRTCPCCDQPVGTGGFFVQGHDARVKGMFTRVSKGKMELSELNDKLQAMYQAWAADKSMRLREIALAFADMEV